MPLLETVPAEEQSGSLPAVASVGTQKWKHSLEFEWGGRKHSGSTAAFTSPPSPAPGSPRPYPPPGMELSQGSFN